MSQRETVSLNTDAKCANDISMQEAAEMKPEQVKGPSILERGGDEIAAIAGTVKSAVVNLFSNDQQSDKAKDDRPYKHS